MKKKIIYNVNGKRIEKEYNFIPVRYILAALITLLEVLAIIGMVIALCYYVPYFYIAAWVTEIVCVIRIISSDDNPEYKIPWLLFVLILPIAGFMLYFIFYSRKLSKKYVKRSRELKSWGYVLNDRSLHDALRSENATAQRQANMLCRISEGHLYTDTKQTYFSLGEEMWKSLLADLKRARRFIYMEYFIIEQGVFWDSILDILKEKAKNGVEVKVLYDDIGCMSTLAGDYSKTLKEYGIEGIPFSRLKGAADGEFNNRSHRKITVIDGFVAYTGGVNIADEYINEVVRFGHWKDTAIRLEGEAVWELTRLFLIDFGINAKTLPARREDWYPHNPQGQEKGYLIPFGDGPKPIFERRVGQNVIRNMIASATKYVYITTPYLIIDNELCQALESAALRGVGVKLITPHVPDKKLVFGITRSFYTRLMGAGVEIYEYEPGFIHAKNYLVDGEYGMIGTINLDYRSLVHHFENGVWMYRCACLKDMEKDFLETMKKSIPVTEENVKANLLQRGVRAVGRIFSALL